MARYAFIAEKLRMGRVTTLSICPVRTRKAARLECTSMELTANQANLFCNAGTGSVYENSLFL